ncbi:MAG: glycerophosphodiester phosphodiesterase family protein [Acidimicrobiales bacterium]
MNLDIKGTAPVVEPYEELLAEELRRLDLAGRTIVASFHDDVLARFRTVASEIPTSGSTNETVAFFFSHLEDPVVPPVVAFQVPTRYGDVDVVTESFLEAAHAAGIAVHVWTINDADEMARLIDLGVDGLVSDRPSVLGSVLAERGCAWDGNLSGT